VTELDAIIDDARRDWHQAEVALTMRYAEWQQWRDAGDRLRQTAAAILFAEAYDTERRFHSQYEDAVLNWAHDQAVLV
jgi:hypothetical protein